ncbi:MAG: PIN domain nuclease [Actinomycetota bacterium]|nr:PIN domain nuclease [Actinomycetota bacterium]
MGARGSRALVLGSGALIAFERNDKGVRQLVRLAFHQRVPIHIPAGVVAQVWRDGRGQVRLARLINTGEVEVHELDLTEAKAAGVLCGLSGTADVVDTSIVLLARRHKAVVVTSEVDDIRRIDSTIELRRC